MRAKSPYILLSIGLVLTGVWLAPVAQILLKSTPLTVLGISLVILGAVCFFLGRTRLSISPEVSTLLMETGLENMATLVNELGLNSKAIYLPSSITNGTSKALIPLNSNPFFPHIEKNLPQRLIVKYGPNPEEIGLLITTPGSATINMQDSELATTAAEIEDVLSFVLTEALNMVNAVRVAMNEEKVSVKVSKPKIKYKSVKLYECLGSPLASIVAALVAENLVKPIVIENEVNDKNTSTIELGILK